MHSERTIQSELAASYKWCWRVVRNSDSSFYRSFFLLKEPARSSIAALYAFARITDDLGDSARLGEASEQQPMKSELLRAWLLRLQAAVSGSGVRARAISYPTDGNGNRDFSSLQQYELLWSALTDTVRKYSIPPKLLEDIVRGVMMDLDTVRIADWDELFDYCYHVASAVGLACTHVWNASDRLPVQAAIDCGIAFQLTNILRDVREDAVRGRIYVPQLLLEQFACSESAWLRSQPDGNWQGCVDSLLAAAREFYASGWRTREFLGTDGRKMFSLMWRTYRQLLDEVQRRKAVLWSDTRVRLPNSARWRLAASHFVPSWYRHLPDPSFEFESPE